ncbi:MAG: hypothetical protein Q9166_005841 [cf. Caloplaca sp. 2 TL-2023]
MIIETKKSPDTGSKALSCVDDEDLGSVVQAALKLDAIKMAEAAASVVEHSLPPLVFRDKGRSMHGSQEVNMVPGDVKTIVQLSGTYEGTFTFQNLLPLVMGNMGNLKLIFAHLQEFSSDVQSDIIVVDTRKNLFKTQFTEVVTMIPSECKSISNTREREDNAKRRRFH